MNKKESLLGILQPIPAEDNLAMLRAAGFPSAAGILKHLCFEGLVAVK